jgi:thymidylate kinase
MVAAMARRKGATMAAIVLVGPDGAGKTTIAKALVESLDFPVRYLYMGLNPISSNRTLPTSRLVRYIKLRTYEREVRSTGGDVPEKVSAHSLKRRSGKRGPLWRTARFVNRMVEALYRQWLIWSCELRGYVVIGDRHFLIDTAIRESDSQEPKKASYARLEHWILSHAFPEPDLVIFLDAPAEVLYARKQERTPKYLERRRRVIMEQGRKMDNFVRVDATQPPDKVLAEVTQLVLEFCSGRCRRTSSGGDRLAASGGDAPAQPRS